MPKVYIDTGKCASLWDGSLWERAGGRGTIVEEHVPKRGETLCRECCAGRLGAHAFTPFIPLIPSNMNTGPCFPPFCGFHFASYTPPPPVPFFLSLFHFHFHLHLHSLERSHHRAPLHHSHPTDTQWAYWDGLRAFEAKSRPYLQGQIGNPEGADKPNKKYYDPRKWVREAEKAMVKR